MEEECEFEAAPFKMEDCFTNKETGRVRLGMPVVKYALSRDGFGIFLVNSLLSWLLLSGAKFGLALMTGRLLVISSVPIPVRGKISLKIPLIFFD